MRAGYQVRFTDALQTKIDELAALAKESGADAAAVDAIKNRPNCEAAAARRRMYKNLCAMRMYQYPERAAVRH